MDEIDRMQGAIRRILEGALLETNTLKAALIQEQRKNERLSLENQILNKDKSSILALLLERTCSNCDRDRIARVSNVELHPKCSNDAGFVDRDPPCSIKEDVPHLGVAVETKKKAEEVDDNGSCLIIGAESAEIPVAVPAKIHPQKGSSTGCAVTNPHDSSNAPNSPVLSKTTKRVLDELLGPSQPCRPPVGSRVLAPESPEPAPHSQSGRPLLSIPETMPQMLNERTPQKPGAMRHNPRTPQYSIGMEHYVSSIDHPRTPEYSRGMRHNVTSIDYSVWKPEDFAESKAVAKPTPGLSSPIRVLSLQDINSRSPASKDIPLDRSQVISPLTKKARCAKTDSPKGNKSPARAKRNPALKKGRRIEPEMTSNGVRKMTQTQLNISSFKKSQNKSCASPILASMIPSTPSPQKRCEDDVIPESPCGKEPPAVARPSTPLHDIGNSPDMNETMMSVSAARQVVSEIARAALRRQQVDVNCSYDRMPDRTIKENARNKEFRRNLPGQECPDCDEFYRAFGDAEGRLINGCSRHRTRKDAACYTPEGFWKPVISQTSMVVDEENLAL